MDVMSSKTSARGQLLPGAPVVPGTTEALKSLDDARATAPNSRYRTLARGGARII